MSAIDVVRTCNILLATGEQSIHVVGLLRDPDAAADLAYGIALPEPDLRLTQDRDDLFGRSSLPCHVLVSIQEVGNSRIRNQSLGSD
jgi:hypothetical protein